MWTKWKEPFFARKKYHTVIKYIQDLQFIWCVCVCEWSIISEKLKHTKKDVWSVRRSSHKFKKHQYLENQTELWRKVIHVRQKLSKLSKMWFLSFHIYLLKIISSRVVFNVIMLTFEKKKVFFLKKNFFFSFIYSEYDILISEFGVHTFLVFSNQNLEDTKTLWYL